MTEDKNTMEERIADLELELHYTQEFLSLILMMLAKTKGIDMTELGWQAKSVLEAKPDAAKGIHAFGTAMAIWSRAIELRDRPDNVTEAEQ